VIDLTAPVELSVRGIRAWADLEDPGRVWACSDGPRWSVGADGQPDVRVMLYHRGTGPVEGGTVTANVDLALTGEERETVLREVGEQRAAQAERADAVGTPVPRAVVPTACVPLECTAGDIELHLVPGLTAEAGVSLTGDNRATFMLTLDASTGPGLAVAWADGLPEARAVAHLRVRSSAAGEATATTTSTGPSLRSSRAVAVTVTRAVEVPLTLEADLRVPSSLRSTHLSDLAL
jgi:hypothetical protein